MPDRALGRLPHDPDRPVLKLADFLTGDTTAPVPAHPAFADYLASVPEWGLYGNDRYGVCGPTAVANQRRQVSLYLGLTMRPPSQEDVFDLYRRSGNPNFDPATGADDNGVIMADMLSALLSGGIGGQKPVAYAAVDVSNPDEIHAAIALFGSVLFGVDLRQAQQAQTDHHQAWDYVRRSPEWGGHAVLAGAYTGDASPHAADVSVISWAERIGTTDLFCDRQLQEAWVVIWPEVFGSTEFEAGVDVAALAQAYTALTGRPFPAFTPPTPIPPPGQDPDSVFRAKLEAFVADAHDWLGK